MGFGLKRDRPSELELRSAALEADEHFLGLTEIAQNQKRIALVNNYEHYQRVRKIGQKRYLSAMGSSAGMMVLFCGLASAPRVETFMGALLLGVILGAVMEFIEGGTILFAIGCGLGAFLLGTMTGSFTSVFLMPIGASFMGAAYGTTRWF